MAGATSFLDFPTHPLRHVVLVWLRALLRDAGDQQVVPLCDIVLSIEHLDELGHHGGGGGGSFNAGGEPFAEVSAEVGDGRIAITYRA
eukprot:COSAG04_NODE_3213_length_3044_cov_1.344992_4_plen_88_part_00